MTNAVNKQSRLLELVSSYGSCAVAFSGGVDSAVVAKAAAVSLGRRAVAVTGVSASLAKAELDSARELAELIGIRHVEIPTGEVSNPAYVVNAPDRCYYCKTELYTQIAGRLDELGVETVLSGANADDLGDYRPGLQAASEHHVRYPLAECGITKAEVRELAALWELPVADKPASPCLSSRVAYGLEVTPERLRRIEQAETLVRQLGLTEVRVRYHQDDLARIEVPTGALGSLAEDRVREQLLKGLTELGFKYVTLDLAGFRSGSLNDLVPLELKTRFSKTN